MTSVVDVAVTFAPAAPEENYVRFGTISTPAYLWYRKGDKKDPIVEVTVLHDDEELPAGFEKVPADLNHGTRSVRSYIAYRRAPLSAVNSPILQLKVVTSNDPFAGAGFGKADKEMNPMVPAATPSTVGKAGPVGAAVVFKEYLCWQTQASLAKSQLGDYSVGDPLDVKDTQHKWMTARVIQENKEEGKIYVHYDGWADKWNEWIAKKSKRLAPYRSQTKGTRTGFKGNYGAYQFDAQHQSEFQSVCDRLHAIDQMMHFSSSDKVSLMDKLKNRKKGDIHQVVLSPEDSIFLTEEIVTWIKNCLNALVDQPAFIPRIQSFLQSNLLLAIHVLRHFPPPIPQAYLDALARIFNSDKTQFFRFYAKHGTQEGDEDKKNSSGKYGSRIYSNETESWTSIYLIANINFFGENNGFKAVEDRLKDEDSSFFTFVSLVKTLGVLRPCLTPKFAKTFITSLKLPELVVTRMKQISDAELKELDRAAFVELVSDLVKVIGDTFAEKELARFKTTIVLDITLRLLHAQVLEKKINALEELDTIITKVKKNEFLLKQRSKPGSLSPVPEEGMLRTTDLLKWLEDNGVVGMILAPGTHEQIIKRSVTVLKFLAVNNSLTEKHLDQLWQHCAGGVSAAHESTVRLVHEAAVSLAQVLSNKQLGTLFSRMASLPFAQYQDYHLELLHTYTLAALFSAEQHKAIEAGRRDESSGGERDVPTAGQSPLLAIAPAPNGSLLQSQDTFYGVPLLWQMVFSSSSSSDLRPATGKAASGSGAGASGDTVPLHIAQLAEQVLCRLLSHELLASQRPLYCNECLSGLRIGRNVVQCLRIMRSIIETYPAAQWPLILSQMDDLLAAIMTDMRRYGSQAKQMWGVTSAEIAGGSDVAAKPPRLSLGNSPAKEAASKPYEPLPAPTNPSAYLFAGVTHDDHVAIRFDFLDFAAANSELSLSTEHLEQLWDVYYTNAAFLSDRNRITEWFRKGLDHLTALDEQQEAAADGAQQGVQQGAVVVGQAEVGAVVGEGEAEVSSSRPPFTKAVASWVFSHLLCQSGYMHPVYVTLPGYLCFEQYLRWQNYENKALLSSSKRGSSLVVMKHSALVGMDSLWRFASLAEDALVSSNAKRLLTSLHLRLDWRMTLFERQDIISHFMGSATHLIGSSLRKLEAHMAATSADGATSSHALSLHASSTSALSKAMSATSIPDPKWKVDAEKEAFVLSADKAEDLWRVIKAQLCILEQYLMRCEMGDMLAAPLYLEGQPVRCRWQKLLRYYNATVFKVNRSGSYWVNFADGDVDRDCPERNLLLRDGSVPARPFNSPCRVLSGWAASLLVNEESNFELLFQLMGVAGQYEARGNADTDAADVSAQAWQLLCRLPLNKELAGQVALLGAIPDELKREVDGEVGEMGPDDIQTAFVDLSLDDDSPRAGHHYGAVDWPRVLPVESAHKFLYALKIVLAQLVWSGNMEPAQVEECRERTARWASVFLKQGGLDYLLTCLAKIEPRYCSQHLFTARAHALLLKVLQLLLQRFFVADSLVATASMRWEMVVKHVLLTVDVTPAYRAVVLVAQAAQRKQQQKDRLSRPAPGLDLDDETVLWVSFYGWELMINAVHKEPQLLHLLYSFPHWKTIFVREFWHIDLSTGLLFTAPEAVPVSASNSSVVALSGSAKQRKKEQEDRQEQQEAEESISAQLRRSLVLLCSPRELSPSPSREDDKQPGFLRPSSSSSSSSQPPAEPVSVFLPLALSCLDELHLVLAAQGKGELTGERSIAAAQYFSLIHDLLLLPQVQEGYEGGSAWFRAEKVAVQLVSLIESWPILEKNVSTTDVVLKGLLSAAFAVVRCRPSLRGAQPNSTSKARAVSPAPKGMVNATALLSPSAAIASFDLGMGPRFCAQLVQFLFDVPVLSADASAVKVASSGASIAQPPKCKSYVSRVAAFQLLLELSKDCPANTREVILRQLNSHREVNHHHKQSQEWSYQPENDQRADYAGLLNLGCICYMNALLQQIYMLPRVRQNILDMDLSALTAEERADSVPFQLQTMMGFLQESQKPFFDPRNFCNAFKDMDGNPTNVLVQEDAAGFFTRLIDTVNEAVKGTRDATVFSEVLGGVFSHQLIGEGSCKHFSERAEEFSAVQLEVKNKKSMQESLEQFCKSELLEGYRCDKCKAKVPTLKRCVIKVLPPTIVFVLKRFDLDFATFQTVKCNDMFPFPTRLSLRAYTRAAVGIPADRVWDAKEAAEWKEREEEDLRAAAVSDEEYEYVLRGVVVHTGHANSGHYYSFIQERFVLQGSTGACDGKSSRMESSEVAKVNEGGKWYEFNDIHVQPFDPLAIPQECFGGSDAVPGDGAHSGTQIGPQMQYNQMATGGNQMQHEQAGLVSMMERSHSGFILFYDKVAVAAYPSKSKDVAPAKLPTISASSSPSCFVTVGKAVVPAALLARIHVENLAHWKDMGVFDPRYARFFLALATQFDRFCPENLRLQPLSAALDSSNMPHSPSVESLTSPSAQDNSLEPVSPVSNTVLMTQLCTRYVLFTLSRYCDKSLLKRWVPWLTEAYTRCDYRLMALDGPGQRDGGLVDGAAQNFVWQRGSVDLKGGDDPALVAGRWFLQQWSSYATRWAVDYLFRCPVIDSKDCTKQTITDWLCLVLDQVGPTERHLLREEDEDGSTHYNMIKQNKSALDVRSFGPSGPARSHSGGRGYVLGLVDHLIKLFRIAPTHYKTFDAYFLVLSHITKLTVPLTHVHSPFEGDLVTNAAVVSHPFSLDSNFASDSPSLGALRAQYLCQHNFLAKLIDLYLGDESPLPDLAGFKPGPREGTAWAAEHSHFLSLLRNLVCVSGPLPAATAASNTPKGAHQEEDFPSLSRLSPLLPAGLGMGHPLSPEAVTMLTCRPFIEKIIREAVLPTRDRTLQILRHLCWENRGYTTILLSAVFVGLEQSFYEYIACYFPVMLALMQLQDSLQAWRVDHTMVCLLGTIEHCQQYWRVTEHCIAEILRMAMECAPVFQWLHAHPQHIRWLDQWLSSWVDPPSPYMGSEKMQLYKPRPKDAKGKILYPFPSMPLQMPGRTVGHRQLLCKIHANQALPDDRFGYEEEEDKSERVFHVGQWLDVLDTERTWLCAQVLSVTVSQVYIRYDGWSAKWNEYINISSLRIASFGTKTSRI